MESEAAKSRIPSLRRSASMRVRGERIPSSTSPCCGGPNSSRHSIASVESDSCHHNCGDSASLRSHGSNTSLASCGSSQQTPGDKGSCSLGRRNKFVLHCQRHIATPQETYLTPTQRKDRELRSLRTALAQATRDAENKSLQLRELTQEIERLRHDRPLTPHSEAEGSQSEGSVIDGIRADAKAITCTTKGVQASRYAPKQVQTEDSSARCVGSVSAFVQTTERDRSYPSSLLNNGLVTEPHEDGDLYNDDIHYANWITSTASLDTSKKDEATRADDDDDNVADLKRKYRDLRQKYNDRTENLLQMLSDLNAKYLDLRPAYEGTQDRLRDLERQLIEARQEIQRQEQWHSEMYLKMYRKGKQAAKFEQDEDGLFDGAEQRRQPGSTVSPLLQQLRRADREVERNRDSYSVPQLPAIHGVAGDRQAEYTLRFLKDAVFYFLTDRTDFRGHLNAIQSILGFSEGERAAVAKVWRNRGRL